VTTDEDDGTNKLVLGPWWCRDLAPEYVTDYVRNPINTTLYVDMSAMSGKLGWMSSFFGVPYMSPPIPLESKATDAKSFPGGMNNIALPPYYAHAYGTAWEYRYSWSGGGDTVVTVVHLAPIENIALPNFPPICYALGIYFQSYYLRPPATTKAWYNGVQWFGVKSGNTPRGDYTIACSNSCWPLSGYANLPWRIYWRTGGLPTGPQLCPSCCEYTPGIFTFTVT
jgi:hypothetical protein